MTARVHEAANASDVSDDVVLVDDDNRVVGSADRLSIHDRDTPLHRAFSLYLFDEHNRVLITRRALTKATWPGVWTNGCCGHPRPGEQLIDAVRRRTSEELGATVTDLRLVLPDFRYRAVDASGIVENEICPVFTGRLEGPLLPDPAEVGEHAWVEWRELVSATQAVPQAFSPWSVLQVRDLVSQVGAGAAPLPEWSPTLAPSKAFDSTLTAIDDELAAAVDRLRTAWREVAPGEPDVIEGDPGDFPDWLGSQLRAGGKRIRPQMCHWGFIAAEGEPDSFGYGQMVKAASALELLHLFALIHDDVMDGSLSRRGAPAVHVVAALRHESAQAHGSPSRFGENLAILLGDLAHSVADRQMEGLSQAIRDCWNELKIELIAGQRADLTGAAAGRTDLQHAETVAALKSGSYSIERPLRLGAIAAEATASQREALARFGFHLGRAFAWRDDVLGVWGDAKRTGKPAGDDLREGKATLIWVMGNQRLSGEAAEALTRVRTTDRRPDDVPFLQSALTAAGVRDEIEGRIADELRLADTALDSSDLTQQGIAGLRQAAEAIGWRDS